MRHILIAQNAKAARNWAEIDMGWVPIRPGAWRLNDGSGDEVVYASDDRVIMGSSWKTARVYLGLRWYESKDAERMYALARLRGHAFVYDPEKK